MSNRPTHIRFVVVMACALALAVVATATQPKAPGAQPPDTPQATAQAAPRVVIVRDAQTGMLRPATAQEAQTMASQIDQLLGRGPTATRRVTLPDGSTAFALTGNFANGTVARRNADGTIETVCFDEPGPAKVFLGLVPGSQVPPATQGR
jgi:hypothetical protein